MDQEERLKRIAAMASSVMLSVWKRVDRGDLDEGMQDFLLQDVHAHLQLIDDLATSENPHVGCELIDPKDERPNIFYTTITGEYGGPDFMIIEMPKLGVRIRVDVPLGHGLEDLSPEYGTSDGWEPIRQDAEL